MAVVGFSYVKKGVIKGVAYPDGMMEVLNSASIRNLLLAAFISPVQIEYKCL